MEIKAGCKYDYEGCKAISYVCSYKKSKPIKAVFIHILLAFILGLADIYLIQSGTLGVSVYFVLGLCVFMVVLELFMYFLMPRIQYNSMSKMKDIGNSYTFHDEYFTAATDSEDYKGDSIIKYTVLEKVMETGKHFFIFQNKREVFLVDKSTLEDGTAEEIRGRLQPVLGKKYIICKY